jgi:uncharacterized membrane protein YgcG
VRFRYDHRSDRVYPVQVLEVSGSPGTPDQYTLEDVESTLRIRIGDPDRTITGRHDYTIVYRVEGALNGFDDHNELYWNAIGTEWEVPLEHASVTVSAPASISQVACYVGPAGSDLSCASSEADGPTASFATTGLDPHEGVTVVVGFPTGAVPVPRPILDERWSLARAFSATLGTLGMAGGVLLALLLVLGWLFGITGRDRQPGAALAPVAGVVVESAPPEGIRPAQAGLFVDEVVNPVAITATVVDLAVRGYLRIEEDPSRDDWEKPNWRLVKLKAADEDLLGYERKLLEGLFASRRQVVRLSDLEKDFSYRFKLVRSWLYRDAVQRRWFTEQPDRVQQRWVTRGLAVTVVGAALTALAVWLTDFGLVAVPVLLAGPVLMVGARRMPRRTPVGAELLRRVNGFQAYLQTGRGRPRRPCPGPRPVLPLPAIRHRVRPHRAMDPDPRAGWRTPQTPWYGSRQPYSPDLFRSRILLFSWSSAATLTASPPAVSGSSGFGGGGSGSTGGGGGGSSGGGGRGGGGSW